MLRSRYSHSGRDRLAVSQRKAPVQKRSAETFECILQAAAHILNEHGLQGFNTNAIAQRAGVSIGSLYQYFPQKEAITAALILRSHQRLTDLLRVVLEKTQQMSFQRALAILLQMLIESHAAAGRLHRILEIEEERLPRTPDLQKLEKEILELNRAFFGRFLDQARPKKELETAGADVVCIVRGLLDAAAQSDALGAPDLQARIARTIEGYLNPLLRRAAPRR